MPFIRRKQVKVGDAAVTVRTSSAWMKTDADTLRNKLVVAMGETITENGITFARLTDDILLGRMQSFILMLVNTEQVDGDLGLPWPSPSAPAADLVRAFREIGDCLDPIELARWQMAIDEVDSPPGPPELAPELPAGEAVSPESRKSDPTSGNTSSTSAPKSPRTK